MPFEWASPVSGFQWLRRFSLRCLNAFGVSWFLWLTPFEWASPVSGFECLRRLMG